MNQIEHVYRAGDGDGSGTCGEYGSGKGSGDSSCKIIKKLIKFY